MVEIDRDGVAVAGDVGGEALRAAEHVPGVLVGATPSLEQVPDMEQSCEVITVEPAPFGFADEQCAAVVGGCRLPPAVRCPAWRRLRRSWRSRDGT
jgi:hypothetical protein